MGGKPGDGVRRQEHRASVPDKVAGPNRMAQFPGNAGVFFPNSSERIILIFSGPRVAQVVPRDLYQWRFELGPESANRMSWKSLVHE